MPTSRLEAFSDGVFAIIITIMVLELRTPEGEKLSDLQKTLPTFLSYVLSFIYIGIYWNNHHHMLHVAERTTGAVMWANLHLLFWLSLVPFATAWAGSVEPAFAPWPSACYGFVLLLNAIAYTILQATIIHDEGPQSKLRAAVGADFKGKLSLALYTGSIPLSFVSRWAAIAIYVAVAAIWLVPDRRIETKVNHDVSTG
jgi:uncharacterized membrane protein